MKDHIKNINDVLVKPLVTEKTYQGMSSNVYTFVVHKNATKTNIKEAIETIFSESKAKVGKINIANVRSKKKRMGKYEGTKSSFKKAIIFLKDGSIPIFGQDEIEDNSEKKEIKRRIITDDILDGKKVRR